MSIQAGLEEIAALEIAVIIPCYNEEQTIAKTIKAFQRDLPLASIYVCDNNSSDDTTRIAKENQAKVFFEGTPGKGNAVRRLFNEVEADVYLLVDGDLTYDSRAAVTMIQKLINERLDMVVGVRTTPKAERAQAYRSGHQAGNRAFNKVVQYFFGKGFSDIFSGYRAFSHRFVKSCAIKSKGFEIETELSVHALELNLPIAEIETEYYARPEGSSSKLNSYRDGFRILRFIFQLLKENRPMFFFSSVAAMLIALAVVIFTPIFIHWLNVHLIPRIPTVILCTGLVLVAVVSFACGMILSNVSDSRRELKRLFYLKTPYFKPRMKSDIESTSRKTSEETVFSN